MKEWLSSLIGESAANIVGFIVLFAAILLAIFIVFALIRRFGGGAFVGGNRSRAPRLSVMDAAAVDSRRKLVLVRRDDVEHLLLIGGPTDLVVEQNIIMEERAHDRREPAAPASRIAPEQIARFREQEEHSGAEALLDLPDSSKVPLQSPLSRPSAAQVMAATQVSPAAQAAPVTQVAPAVQLTPAAPVTSVASPVHAPLASHSPSLSATAARRPVTNVPPQPRTVLPVRPAADPSPRAHPAYPLSQVSRGVVSSASATASIQGGNLDHAVPQRIDHEISAVAPKSEPELAPAAPSKSLEMPSRTEPQMPFEHPKPIDFDLFGDELHEAILDDLKEINMLSESSDSEKQTIGSQSFFEDELLSSLDIAPVKQPESAPNNIEDEMEKLLGELSYKP